MARLGYKPDYRRVCATLARILFGMTMAGLVGGFVACQKKAENDLGSHPTVRRSSDSACEDWVKILEVCPVMRDQSDREDMLAVLREQMDGLSEHDKQKRCQELNSFWQVACGVTPTR